MAEKPKAEKPKGEKPKGEKPKGEKKAKPEKAKAETAKAEAGQAAESGPKVPPRLRQYYVQEVVPALRERFDYQNPMMIPRPIKVVLNVGVGRAHQNPKVLEGAVNDLGTVSGQKPVKTRARKSISNFKLREGMEIGAMVTLRNERMWEFLDRFINVALPRLRDFRGVPSRLSGSGDYTLGLRDQLVFPEIDYDKVDELRGMNVTVVTTARTDEEGRELLSLLGLPFRRA